MAKYTYGTSYFVSVSAANRYYRQYGYAPRDVRRMIGDGVIHIGTPPHPPAKLSVIDRGTRYAVTEG